MRAALRSASFRCAVPLLALASLVPAAAAAFGVVSTNPARYALAVPRSLSKVEATFDAPIVLPSSGAFRVAGSMSGLHTGTMEVVGNTLRLRDFAKPFLPGELVTVNLRRDIAKVGGGTLTGGHMFAFTIASRAVVPDWTDVTVWGTSSIPYFIHGGDLDGDGRPDLAVPNEGTHNVSIFRNTAGTGSFPSHTEYAVGHRPSSIFGEDLDNDGDQDLATADIDGWTVTVLRNGGTGVFTPVASYPAGRATRQVHGGDFDGDNDIDLCATSRATNEVFLFYNNGGGTFVGMSMPIPGGPFAIRTGDLNGDGHLDIGVACQDADSLDVLLNDGSGTFVRSGRYLIGDGPWCLNGNDFDGDGDFDLVSVASIANRIVVLRNDGTGKFPTRGAFPTGSFPLGVFAADLDGDGDIDATSSNYGSATVGVYLNNGAGTLGAPETLFTAASGSYTWAHDLDGDGDLDLSVVDEQMNELFVFRNGGTATDAPTEWLAAGAPRLGVAPNPMRSGSGTRLLLAPAGNGATWIDVFDVAGRRVRRLEAGIASAGALSFAWDGRDAHGRTVAAGRYLAVGEAGGRRLAIPIQVLP